MGENEIGRNGKKAGQVLGGMGKGRSWKGRKKYGRNGKNLRENGLGKLGINLQDCRKNVNFCYCVCFSPGYKVQSGQIQIQFNPLTLPDTIDSLLLKKRNVKKNFSFFFTFNLKQVYVVVMTSPA